MVPAERSDSFLRPDGASGRPAVGLPASYKGRNILRRTSSEKKMSGVVFVSKTHLTVYLIPACHLVNTSREFLFVTIHHLSSFRGSADSVGTLFTAAPPKSVPGLAVEQKPQWTGQKTFRLTKYRSAVCWSGSFFFFGLNSFDVASSKLAS